MEPSSNIDHTSPENGAAAIVPGVAPKRAGLQSRQSGDGGRSLAEMAQRDLDAALQLLADRAQYITGASGAAIALRRTGKNDMLCRASSGPNAPELGALLSTEFGLSGESVRTRQALRCDDAERDIRVNREVCRQMGIASVVVMPVVNDDEVLGVFELFSGKANAFGTRDVSAVQRLSEMVETAVRLAQATETLPQRLKVPELSATEVPQVAKSESSEEDQVLDGKVLQDQDQVLVGEVVEDLILQDGDEDDPVLPVATADAEALPDEARSITRLEALRDSQADAAGSQEPVALQDPVEVAAGVSGNRDLAASEPVVSQPVVLKPIDQKVARVTPAVPQAETSIPAAKADVTVPAETVQPKKLFWSAAVNPEAEAERPEELDQSHVPPVLRTLRKCEACGFPVSAGRLFCVECEEKKWRGQLKAPRAVAKGEVRAFAAAAQSAAASSPAPSPSTLTSRASASNAAPLVGSVGGSGTAVAATSAAKTEGLRPAPAAPSSHAVARETRPLAASAPPPRVKSPEFVLSAGMPPSQSWLAANKYIVGVLLVVGAAVAAVFLLR